MAEINPNDVATVAKEPVIVVKEVPVKPVEEPFKFDANTVLAYLYLMYKTNMISRSVLKIILAEVKKEWPKDIAKYLVEESVK